MMTATVGHLLFEIRVIRNCKSLDNILELIPWLFSF